MALPSRPWGAVPSLLSLPQPEAWSKRLTLTLSEETDQDVPALRKKSETSPSVGAAEGKPALSHRPLPAPRQRVVSEAPKVWGQGSGRPWRTDVWAPSAPHETLLLLVNGALSIAPLVEEEKAGGLVPLGAPLPTGAPRNAAAFHVFSISPHHIPKLTGALVVGPLQKRGKSVLFTGGHACPSLFALRALEQMRLSLERGHFFFFPRDSARERSPGAQGSARSTRAPESPPPHSHLARHFPGDSPVPRAPGRLLSNAELDLLRRRCKRNAHG